MVYFCLNMKALIVNHEGKMVFDEVEDLSPDTHQIKIEVYAAGINRADLLQKIGKYPPPPGESEIIGLEVAGLVTETGAQSKKFKIGDRVMALLSGGGYAEYVCINEDHVMPIPENMNYEFAACIPEVFLTAHQALNELMQLKNGENILIHAGASGVGTAAIQIAKHIGAHVVVTAGTDKKINFCKELGADHGINYKVDPDFDKVIKDNLKLRMDAVMDFIVGPYAEKNLRVLAPDGRWVVLAIMGGLEANINFGQILMKRITLFGSTLRSRDSPYKSNLVNGFSDKYLRLFNSGELKPILDSVYDWGQVNEAHQYMEENRNIGKIILEVT